MARGRAPDAAGGRAGAGSFADACHSLPRREREEGMGCCYLRQGSHLGCREGWLGDIAGGGGREKGLPHVGRHGPPWIPAGATVSWHFLCRRAWARNPAHQDSTVSEAESATPIWQMTKLRLTCPGLRGPKGYRRDPSPAVRRRRSLAWSSRPDDRQQKEDAELNPLRLRVTSSPGDTPQHPLSSLSC